MLSSIAICSRALLKTGCRSISSFNEETAEADTSRNLYAPTRALLLEEFPWGFTETHEACSPPYFDQALIALLAAAFCLPLTNSTAREKALQANAAQEVDRALMLDARAFAAPEGGGQMSDLPPGPWNYETTAPLGGHDGKGHVYLIDANGRKIASIWGPADTKLATVQLMIDAREKVTPKGLCPGGCGIPSHVCVCDGGDRDLGPTCEGCGHLKNATPCPKEENDAAGNCINWVAEDKGTDQ